MSRAQYQKMVFMVAVAEAKRIRKENPNLTYPEAVKKAWKTKKVLDAKKKYDEMKKSKTGSAQNKKPRRATPKSSGRGKRGRGRPKKK